MFATSAGGEVTVNMASESLGFKMAVSPIIDISVGSAAPLHVILVPALDRPFVVGKAIISYVATCAAGLGAGTVDIGHSDGTTTDRDSVVDAYATGDVAAVTEYMSAIMPFATTLRGTTFQTGGLPVVPAGSALTLDITLSAGANTGDFQVIVFWYPLEPGQ